MKTQHWEQFHQQIQGDLQRKQDHGDVVFPPLRPQEKFLRLYEEFQPNLLRYAIRGKLAGVPLVSYEMRKVFRQSRYRFH